MTDAWPVDVLRPQNVAWNIAPRSLRGPTSVSGVTQVVASDAGVWKATFSNVAIRNRTEVLAFRGIAVKLEGMLNPILVPRCGAYQPEPGDNLAYPDARAASPANAGAVSLSVTNITLKSTIVAGQDFSIGERMYRVRSVDYTDGFSSHEDGALFSDDSGYLADGEVSLTFRPKLRDAVALNAVLNFRSPVCRMRLATDNEMDLELQLHRFGAPTVTFVEDI